MRNIKIIESNSDLTTALKGTRKDRGIVQQDLADVIGVSRRVIIDLEKDTANPLFDTARKVAEALGYRIALVPIEAAGYIDKYSPADRVSDDGQEIDDDGISSDVIGRAS